MRLSFLLKDHLTIKVGIRLDVKENFLKICQETSFASARVFYPKGFISKDAHWSNTQTNCSQEIRNHEIFRSNARPIICYVLFPE